MSTYNPGATVSAFHTEPHASSDALNDLMNLSVPVITGFSITSLTLFVITVIIRELTRHKYTILKWRFLQTPMYFSLVVVAITAVSVMALTGLSIQTNAYSTAINGAKDLRTFIRAVVINTTTLSNEVVLCDANNTSVRTALNDVLNEIQNTKDKVESYVDDAITVVHTGQMSGSFLIIMMLFILLAGCLLYVSAYAQKNIPWYGVFGLYVSASIFSLVSAILLLLLTFQANVCMDPKESIAHLWVIDDPTLSYYINCTYDPSLKNPIKTVLDIADLACTELRSLSNPESCTHDIFSKCVTILDNLKCPQMTKGLVDFIAAICVESINAVALTFVASTLMFVAILWTSLAININTN